MNKTKLPPMYSLTAIGLATFLGSALAAGYMLASNYKALGRKELGVYALCGSLVLVLVLVSLPVSLESSPTAAVALVISQIVVVLVIANKLQGPMFATFEEMGGQYHSMWRAVLVGFGASFALMFLWTLLFTMFGTGLPNTPAP